MPPSPSLHVVCTRRHPKMKEILLTISLLLTISAFGQTSRSELANSKLYVKATYFDKKNEFIGLQTRTDLSDTIINSIKFKKIRTEDFTDYSDKHNSNIYYETFTDGLYTLLDNKLNVVQQVNYQTVKEQQGIIFGKPTHISLEFIDTRNSFPRDSLIPTEKTPRKYYQNDNSEIYLVIIPDLKALAVSSNGQFYTKQLFGDNYNDITNGLKNNYQASTKFDIQKGDEIQLFYRRKWYNDTTNLAEYEDKQFKNIKYLGDTVVNNTKALKLEIEGYNYLSGSKDNPEEFFISVTDSGYNVGYQFVPFKNYNTELKLIDNNGSKEFFLQGVTFDTVGNNIYQKIVQVKNGDPYRYFILPFFPMPFIEFGNVQGIITYSKIKGIEKGIKKERTYITNENNIRDIINKSINEIEVVIYFVDKADVEIQIQDFDGNKTLGQLKSSAKQGLNSFVVHTGKLEKGKEYRVQINFKGENGSGSFSNSVKATY
jgi:hypothetical protein